MSKYEWEQGEFKLPTAEFTKLRKRLEQVEKARKQATFDHAQEFWKGLSAKEKRDERAYQDAIERYCYPQRTNMAGGYRPLPGYPNGLDEHSAAELAETLSWTTRRQVETDSGGLTWERCPPRRILKTDMDFPTNRTTSFDVGDEGSIRFNREQSSVTWDIPDNNHAVERAHSDPFAAVFFRGLNNIRWTRDTGGVLVGNDEYNEDNRDVGGGANYTTFAIGPRGEAQDPYKCVEYLDAKGRRRTSQMILVDAEKERKRQERAEAKYRRQAAGQSGGQGRVQRGIPSGGQFTGRHHGDPGLRL